MANIINLVNTIRANASTEYQTRIPQATQTNIAEISEGLLSYQSTQNEFLSSLVNRIALVLVHSKIAKNPLAVLKNGSMPLGKNLEEIFTNPATGTTFDPTGATLLSRTLPDTKSLYHQENRRGQYTVTVSREMLKTAFTSWNDLESLISSIVNSLYSGDNYDEFILMKQIFTSAIQAGEMTIVNVDATTNGDTSKAFVKAVNNASRLMTFPSTNFNSYKKANPSDTAVVTWTPVEDQVLILRSDVSTNIDIEVLAVAFNMNKTDLLAKTLLVDTFGDTNVMGCLVDKSWIIVKDTLSEMTDFFNAKGLYWNYYWNHWQMYSYSLFANAVCFVPYEPVTNITAGTDFPTTGAAGTDLTLDVDDLTIAPSDSTVKEINLSVKSDTLTHDPVLTDNGDGTYTLSTTAGDSGNVVITATVPNGASTTTDYMKDFTITIS